MNDFIRMPADMLVGTWSANKATDDQLKQLPEYVASRARELSSGTILKYVIASLGSGIRQNGDRWIIKCKIPVIKKALGETGSDYSTPRAALVVSQNLLFRPLNESKSITQERFIIGVTTDPEETGSSSEVIIEVSPKYAELIINPKQYISISLKELGSLRESGNIFVYLCLVRYCGIDIRFDKDKLAMLTTKPNQTYAERLSYYSNYSASRRWSLIRRDLQSKINNIQKHTSLIVNIGKPDRGSVLLKVRDRGHVKTNQSIEYKQLVTKICKVTGADRIGASKKLQDTYSKKGASYISERFRFLITNVNFYDDRSGGTLNGRDVGVGLMLNFLSGDDEAFIEFSASRPIAKQEQLQQTPKAVVSSEHQSKIDNVIVEIGLERYEQLLKTIQPDQSKLTNTLARKIAEKKLLKEYETMKLEGIG